MNGTNNTVSYKIYTPILALGLLLAGWSLSTLCMDRPTLVRLTDINGTPTSELQADEFIMGPIAGAQMFILQEIDFETDYHGYTYRGNTRELIDANVYLTGSWAEHELRFMEMVVKATKGKLSNVLDIGANVGTHSMFIAKHAGQVHAIEPWPPIIERLQAFKDENQVDNITIYPVGYASESGSMPYHEPAADNPGTGSFSDSRFPTQQNVIDLPLVVGDEHLEQAGVTDITLIKIDIEGYEKPALQGLNKTIFRDRPTVLIELNVTNEEGIKSKDDLVSLFPADYQFLELNERSQRRTYPWFGEQSLLCSCSGQAYSFNEFDMSFTENGTMVIAAPNEHYSKFY